MQNIHNISFLVKYSVRAKTVVDIDMLKEARWEERGGQQKTAIIES